jgi:hypothetical protein
MTYAAVFHRCFAWERAGGFVYLALERCARTLYDAVMVDPTDHSQDDEERLPDDALWLIARDAVEGVHVRPLKTANYVLMLTCWLIHSPPPAGLTQWWGEVNFLRHSHMKQVRFICVHVNF